MNSLGCIEERILPSADTKDECSSEERQNKVHEIRRRIRSHQYEPLAYLNEVVDRLLEELL